MKRSVGRVVRASVVLGALTGLAVATTGVFGLSAAVAAGTPVNEVALQNGDAFIRTAFVEVGARPNGSFGSNGVQPSGWHGNSSNQLGFMSDRDKDGWALTQDGTDDGDFFLPGEPYEAWGIQVGSATALINDNQRTDITGSFVGVDATNDPTALWASTGSTQGISVRQRYWLPTDGTQTLNMNVTLTNTTAGALEVHYLRSVDPDNCRKKGYTLNLCDYDGDGVADSMGNTHKTLDKVLGHRANGDDVSAVDASQTDGSHLVLWSRDSASTVLTEAPSNGSEANFCLHPTNLKVLYDAPRTYTPTAPLTLPGPCGSWQGASTPGLYFNKTGEQVFLDGVMYLIIKATIPAGASASFHLAYSLAISAYTADSTKVLPSTGAGTTTPLVLGVGMLGLGVGLTLFGRRRRLAAR